MPSNHPLLLLALAPAVAYARGADASQPHPHRGTLTPYKAQPPSKYGLDVGNVPLKQLRSGKPVWQLVTRVAIPRPHGMSRMGEHHALLMGADLASVRACASRRCCAWSR